MLRRLGEPFVDVGAGGRLRRRSSTGTSASPGGLTTPAMWPEPASTNRTGPPKNFEPSSTDFAGAM